MNRLGCLTLVVSLCAAVALPILFPSVTSAALVKLGIPGDLAVMILLGMLIGSAINIPLWRLPSPRLVRTDPLAVIGLAGLLPRYEDHSKRMVIAINVGGCLIPLVVVAYQIVLIAGGGRPPGVEPTAAAMATAAPGRQGILIALFLSVLINAIVCSKVARPISGVGIALPGILPGVLAGACALLFAAETAPTVALVSGVLGPLLGADLARLPHLKRTPVGLQSIGGAGTFDAIVFSCVVSVCLGG